jgi:hypothetical protein
MDTKTVRDLLLLRRGRMFPESPGESVAQASPGRASLVGALELELAELGFILSTRLAAHLAHVPLAELVALHAWMTGVLGASLGANRKHEPLFRSFPEGIPEDTSALWWSKVLVHFLQAEGQPCLSCCAVSTSHVLDPCRHVVCDVCFDGASYSACPICERHVDRGSPFFLATPARTPAPGRPVSPVRFKLLDLGADVDTEAMALFATFCARKQAMSPGDVDAFRTLIAAYGVRALAWLPEVIPVRENVALVFGTLLPLLDADAVGAAARRFLATATDVLRVIAVLSGADPSLQGQTVTRDVPLGAQQPSRWWGAVAKALGLAPSEPRERTRRVSLTVKRFKVARLPRPLRRVLLALLEGFALESLTEDMRRHRSYWVWVGQLLHPHEYAKRFPKVARAFAVVRKKAPDGTPAPRFRGYHGKLDEALRRKDAGTLLALLEERPGEFARRFDHAARVLQDDPPASAQLLAAFARQVSAFATPVLLTLHGMLPTRLAPAPVRLYWPKGQLARGASAGDARPVLLPHVVTPARRAVRDELLRRFGAQRTFESAVIDAALATIVVPFNERTASRSAVTLPRGSRVPVPAGKVIRLFLHWCEPEKGGRTTDIDLSVGFYDAAWGYKGVCSYYELKAKGAGGRILATSAGDLQDAPFPDGATELVDLDREAALESGVRYAVMVVNNFAGMTFHELERGYAGLMVRDHADGAHFDPRAVELKFALDGDNGIFLPLVFDLEAGTLHWVDVYAKGRLELNNVATSNADITRMCPNLITYFGTGERMSMLGLAQLHAAARARRVFVRGLDGTTSLFVRSAQETPAAFLARLDGGQPDEARVAALDLGEQPVFAALMRGDVTLPEGSVAYALFREQLTWAIAASDLLV